MKSRPPSSMSPIIHPLDYTINDLGTEVPTYGEPQDTAAVNEAIVLAYRGNTISDDEGEQMHAARIPRVQKGDWAMVVQAGMWRYSQIISALSCREEVHSLVERGAEPCWEEEAHGLVGRGGGPIGGRSGLGSPARQI
ncbi:hypothetical protein MRS44_009186 [Fusarium solani]|uniref:uncharacterized protein n=1 Tax=Fusarium solani TaxID=169388 RepID=UPI0032C4229D|nr:hypothetical protein MRS44_009186 [Fusarium solani]